MAEFRFTNEHSLTEVAGVIDVLRSPRLWIPTSLDYPTHTEWLEKTEAEIKEGKKRAMIAYMVSAIGTVIYQRHKDDPLILEVKNISVAPDARGRHIASFLLRNSEIEAARHDFPDINKVIVDTKVSNTEMINFLLSQGYTVDKIVDLYGLGTGMDVILAKSINGEE